jgi:MULE transposase domain
MVPYAASLLLFAVCMFAGAIPVCVLLHKEQSEATYLKCFHLARRVTNINPAIFMTDDSTAERNALRSVFPAAKLFLCLFHRSQVGAGFYLVKCLMLCHELCLYVQCSVHAANCLNPM